MPRKGETAVSTDFVLQKPQCKIYRYQLKYAGVPGYWTIDWWQQGPVTNKRSIGWCELTQGRWLGWGSQLSLALVFCFLQTRAARPGVSCDGSTGNKSALRHNTVSRESPGICGGIKLDRVTQSISQSLSHNDSCCPSNFQFVQEWCDGVP